MANRRNPHTLWIASMCHLQLKTAPPRRSSCRSHENLCQNCMHDGIHPSPRPASGIPSIPGALQPSTDTDTSPMCPTTAGAHRPAAGSPGGAVTTPSLNVDNRKKLRRHFHLLDFFRKPLQPLPFTPSPSPCSDLLREP